MSHDGYDFFIFDIIFTIFLYIFISRAHLIEALVTYLNVDFPWFGLRVLLGFPLQGFKGVYYDYSWTRI